MSIPRGFRGWELEYNSGEIILEGSREWKQAPKTNIVRLTLHYDGRHWDLHNKVAYFQRKRASVVPGHPESFRIESRTIGYYEGKQKITYTVNEDSGHMDIKVEDII